MCLAEEFIASLLRHSTKTEDEQEHKEHHYGELVMPLWKNEELNFWERDVKREPGCGICGR